MSPSAPHGMAPGQMLGMNPGMIPGMNGGMHMGPSSPGDAPSSGLRPEHHITGFSIRKQDGTAIPLIFEAAVGKARDTVILKLTAPVPSGAVLWYGHGLDPQCNLTDGLDMAVPVFGPIDLDETTPAPAAASTAAPAPARATARSRC